jgi:hypothetical protein
MTDPRDLLASDLGDHGRREAAEARRLQLQLDLSIWFEALLIGTIGAIAVARVVAG